MTRMIFSTAILLSMMVNTCLEAAHDVAVQVDPAERYQTVEGWGVSLCWWAHMIGQWEDEAKIDEIVDWLTAPDKLNMNIFRYNIGGGDDPSHYSTPAKPGHMARGKGERAEMPGFKASEDSPYDWDADAGQRRIMLKIKEKRPDAIFEAFSNSPPFWMTYSGCSGGNIDAAKDNLKPEYYDAFCDYLVDVCKHYKNEYGIEFKTLEPFNEPQSNFWNFEGSQEGCHFDIASQIKLIKILHSKLRVSGLNTVIAASDETNMVHFIAALKGYMADEEVLDMVGQLNTHSYDGTNEQRVVIEELTRKVGKTFWQSETGNFSRSTGLVNNLELAQKCFDDMRYMKPSAWLDWQFIEGGDTWCQINVNFRDKNEQYRVIKNLYVRMQITRFIKQGYGIIGTDDNHTLAALNPEGTELVLCHINLSGEERNVSFDLTRFREAGPNVSIYRTNATENCEPKPNMQISGNKVNLTCANNTITTLVIPVR